MFCSAVIEGTEELHLHTRAVHTLCNVLPQPTRSACASVAAYTGVNHRNPKAKLIKCDRVVASGFKLKCVPVQEIRSRK